MFVEICKRRKSRLQDRVVVFFLVKLDHQQVLFYGIPGFLDNDLSIHISSRIYWATPKQPGDCGTDRVKGLLIRAWHINGQYFFPSCHLTE